MHGDMGTAWPWRWDLCGTRTGSSKVCETYGFEQLEHLEAMFGYCLTVFTWSNMGDLAFGETRH